ncbi:PTS sugar transporter subunit IIA [Paenibacillus macerans]|uniref:BglG family transcription antiterminator n=1 Tax=Paenibacillus macerans TaxID=44252 RepID=UPI00203DAEC7|nr:PTS sugar transporter subunit IIA [Paenibacillus macerans]MCM3699691.1 PTS sugar transporter subunit IIA [Paenibacillus macerans]
MHEKLITLINLLMESSKPIPGVGIAEHLKLSRRTVINYINEINDYAKNSIIMSSPNGYYLDKAAAASLLNTRQSAIPQNYQERAFYIIRAFLINHVELINIYDLCDELCISFSLLKNDLKKMNQSYSFLKVKFVTQNNCIRIIGDERSKRQLVNYVLQRMQDSDLIDIHHLKNFFDNKALEAILKIIDTAYVEKHYYINDFSRVNLLLHFLIMVNRIKSGNIISEKTTNTNNYPLNNTPEYELVNFIKNQLEQSFSIAINNEEYIQLYLIVCSNSNYNMNTVEALNSYVDQDLLHFINKLLQEIEQKYYLDLHREGFRVMFTLHIKNFLFRLNSNIIVKSPLKNDLRNTLPFLYDIAIYITDRLINEFHITSSVNEDEISFILIHLAAEIERNNIIEKSVKCLLFVPKYLNIEQEVTKRILYYFGNQLVITKVLSYEDSINDSEFDLLISTTRIAIKSNHKIINISPFLTNSDISMINNAIAEIQNTKQIAYLSTNFHNYFNADNFIISHSQFTDKCEPIEYLCDLLLKNGCVKEDFYSKVISRENSVSTGYDGFAIPHAISLDAVSNEIAVLISPSGIKWDNQNIYVVFMMSVSPDTLIDFQELYAGLSLLLTETNVIGKLRKCKSFEDFKEILLTAYFEV